MRPTKQANQSLIIEILVLTVVIGLILIYAMPMLNIEFLLFVLLFVGVRNFSLPYTEGSMGLVPIVALSSILILGREGSIFATAVGFLLAESTRFFWQDIWEGTPLIHFSRVERWLTHLTYFIPVVIGGSVYIAIGGEAPLLFNQDSELFNAQLFSHLGTLSLSFFLSYFLTTLVVWFILGQKGKDFVAKVALNLFVAGFLAQPFGLFGGITLGAIGFIGFLIFSLGILAFAIIIWLSWERQFSLEKQLNQLVLLNEGSISLRESLDLNSLWPQIGKQIRQFLPMERETIYLQDGNQWVSVWKNEAKLLSPKEETADSLINWVVERKQLLSLNEKNIHYAAEHQIFVPQPTPKSWIGVPLISAEQTIGVIVLQNFERSISMTQWQKELLLAVAGQVAAAIQNGRLYQEVVRLYNLSDQALGERLKQLQALLNSTQEGVLLIDPRGRISLVNKRATYFLNKTVEQLQGKRVDTAELAPYLGYGTVAELDQLLIQLQKGALPEPKMGVFELPAQVTGSCRFVERMETAVKNNEQELLGWLIVLRDVTEAEELSERRQDLTRMIVHDLRNPVTTLMSTVNLLEQKLPSSFAELELVDAARLGCLNMLDMIDSLLDINRMEEGKMIVDVEAMHFMPLVEKVVQRLNPLALQHQVEIEIIRDEGITAVWGDEELLRRVLINLLDNALKFTPVEGVIQIIVTAAKEAQKGYERGVQCTIRDSGPGIPEGFQDRVFDRFMTINQGGAQVRGTGLGLTFCQLAIQAQKGHIWVEKQADWGGCFIFNLPGPPIL